MALATITNDYEILVVDDGSTDGTLEVATAAAAGHDRVRVLRHAENQGYGAAIRTGLEASRKQLIGFTDADCQFELHQLDRLVLLLGSCDIACGYRIDRQDNLLRKLYSRGYNLLARLLLGTSVRDLDCALKLMHREVLPAVCPTTDGFLFNAELLARANLQDKAVVEVGVDHRPRTLGTSTVSFRHILPVLLALLRFWWADIQFPGRETSHTAASSWGGLRTAMAASVLGGLCLLMFFWHLSYPLFEPDESRYVQVALEMVQSHDYIIPQLHGEPYLDKPPLLYWTTAGSFWAFGINEMSARLVPACAASWTVLAMFLLGARLFGRRIAWISSLLLLLSIGFVLAGRFVLMDSLLACFTTSSLLTGLLAVRGKRLSRRWWILAALFAGLGIFTKGPIALLLVVPPLLALTLLDQHTATLRPRHWLAFVSIAFGITSPWFVAMFVAEPSFAGHFLWKHNIVRFVAAFDHQQPFWFYLPVLLIGMFPCSVLTAPALCYLGSRREAIRQLRTPEFGFAVLSAAWIILFFTASSCKLPTYVLPAAPLLCVVAAFTLDAYLLRSQQMPLQQILRRLPSWTIVLALLIGSGLATADLVFSAGHSDQMLIDWLVIIMTALVLIHRLTLRPWPLPPSSAAAWTTTSAVCFVLVLFGFQKFVPEIARHRSIHANLARICENRADVPIAFLDWDTDAQQLYLKQTTVSQFDTKDMSELASYLQAHAQVIFVANDQGAEDIRERFRAHHNLAATAGRTRPPIPGIHQLGAPHSPLCRTTADRPATLRGRLQNKVAFRESSAACAPGRICLVPGATSPP